MTDGSDTKGTGRLARYMPVLAWLPLYEKSWFRHDLFAALTVAAFAVPNLMAFSQLAGLPPQYGLYGGIGAGIGYFFFGTIKRLSVGPTAAQSIMLASVLAVLVVSEDFDDPAAYLTRYVSLAVLVTMMVGVIFLVARVLRLGFIADLIPLPVFKGFMAGMGITIILSQLPLIFGVPGVEGDFFTHLFDLLGKLGDTNLPTLGLGLLLLVMMLALDRRFKRFPNPLLVVVFSVVVMTVTDLHSRGVAIVGDIPSGIPTPIMPEVSQGDVRALLPLAFGLFLLSFVETTSVGKQLESKGSYRMDPNQELVALGAANIGSGLIQGFPVSGSVSRSLLNEISGAKTQMASLLVAMFLLVVVMFLTGLLHNMPTVVMGVIIIVAVIRVIDFTGLHRIRAISPTAFAVAMASFASVLAFGILEGVLIGVVISFIYILFRITSPSVSVLGRIPGSPDYKDVSRNDEYILYPGVLILRFDAPLVFANAHTIRNQILDMVEYEKYVELVVMDLETSPMVDVTASVMLGELDEDLKKMGIAFRLANCTGEVRDMLNATYPEERVGHIGAETTVNSTVEWWFEMGPGNQVE